MCLNLRRKRKRRHDDSESESEEIIRGRNDRRTKKWGLDAYDLSQFTKESIFERVVRDSPDLSEHTESEISKVNPFFN